MDPITYDQLSTVAGLTGTVWIATQIVVRATGWTGATRDRFAPVVAAAIGVAIGAVASIATAGDPILGAINGLVAGGAAMGFHDTVATTTGLGAYGT